MSISRNYYKIQELRYLVNTRIDIMVQDTVKSTWKLKQFKVDGVHEDYVYGITDGTTSGRPYFIFYTHIVSAPEYDKLKTTNLFKLVKDSW